LVKYGQEIYTPKAYKEKAMQRVLIHYKNLKTCKTGEYAGRPGWDFSDIEAINEFPLGISKNNQNTIYRWGRLRCYSYYLTY